MMARYELGDEFWEIEQDAAALVITSGAIGRSGKQSVRKFISADHAARQRDKLVAEKLAAGFAEVGQPVARPSAERFDDGGEPRDVALEAALVDDPTDEQAYLVYSDWLQRAGHPRGELIALQLAEEARPDDKRLAVASRKFLAANSRALVGDTLAADMRLAGAGEGALIWRFGFIHRLDLVRDDDDYDLADLIERVVRHPSGRFLTEIAIRDHEREIRHAIARLGKLAPRALRSLTVNAAGDLGDLAPLRALSRLARFAIKVNAEFDGSTYHRALSAKAVRTIAHAPWPLQTLELYFGGDASFSDLAPLFRRTDLTHLRELRFHGARFTDQICAALVASPFAPQLTTLELGMVEINDQSLELLLAHRDRFASLRQLGVSRQLVSARLVVALARVIDRVVDVPIPMFDEEFDGVME